MPQAVVRPSLAIADERTERRPVSDAVRGFDGRGSHGQSRAIATAANHGRRQESTCDACALRTSAASDRPTAAAPGPSCALSRSRAPWRSSGFENSKAMRGDSGPTEVRTALSRPQKSPMAQPGFEISKERCAAPLGPRKCGKCGLSGAITAPNDRFHVITQLNARDGPAKGRTSVLIDEERVRD